MKKKTKKQTAEDIVQESRRELTAAIADGSDKELLLIKIRELATRYADVLEMKITERGIEMEGDDDSHWGQVFLLNIFLFLVTFDRGNGAF